MVGQRLGRRSCTTWRPSYWVHSSRLNSELKDHVIHRSGRYRRQRLSFKHQPLLPKVTAHLFRPPSWRKQLGNTFVPTLIVSYWWSESIQGTHSLDGNLASNLRPCFNPTRPNRRRYYTSAIEVSIICLYIVSSFRPTETPALWPHHGMRLFHFSCHCGLYLHQLQLP